MLALRRRFHLADLRRQGQFLAGHFESSVNWSMFERVYEGIELQRIKGAQRRDRLPSKMGLQFGFTSCAARWIQCQWHVEQLQSTVFERIVLKHFYSRQGFNQPNDVRFLDDSIEFVRKRAEVIRTVRP